jgi:ribosomal protein S18 acetylase RimI-like enzyme
MDIRVLRPEDIPHVQLANITNLPENYFCKYYLYHAMSWPQLSYVAVDVSISSISLLSYPPRAYDWTCERDGRACDSSLNARERDSYRVSLRMQERKELSEDVTCTNTRT